MITASNYNTQITKVNFSELPPFMQKMHDQLIVEKNGLNYYGKNDDITRVIDTYLKKLNEATKTSSSTLPSIRSKIASNMAEFKRWLKANIGETIYFLHTKYGKLEPRKIKTVGTTQASFIKQDGKESWLDFSKAANWTFQNDYAKFESAEWGDMRMYYFYQNPSEVIVQELLEKSSASKTNTTSKSAITRRAVHIIDGKKYDLTDLILPVDHPIMVLDTDSSQWKSAVKEYFDENSNNRKSASSTGTSRKATSRKSASTSSGSQSKPKAGSKKRAATAKANNGSKAKPKAKVTAKRKSTTTKRKTATKAKSTTPRKAVEKPLVHRRVKSPELTAITRFINLNGKKKTLASLESFLKIVTNALAAKKYVDHKPLMAKIKTNLQKGIKVMKDNSISSVLVEFDEKLLEQCKKVQANAKEKLRVSYLGGIPEGK